MKPDFFKNKPTLRQNILATVFTTGGFLVCLALVFNWLSFTAQKKQEELKGKGEELIEKSKVAESQNVCLFLGRGSYIDLDHVDIIRLPAFNDLSNEKGVSTFIIPTNGNYIEAYFLSEADDNSSWSGISFPVAYQVIEENEEIVLSFEKNVLYRYISSKYLLVVLVPKNLVKTVSIQAFTNGSEINLNSPKYYNIKVAKGGIFSGFNELATVKDIGEEVSAELSQFLSENISMGQLIVPKIEPLNSNILPPTISPMTEAHFLENFEEIVCPNFIELFN